MIAWAIEALIASTLLMLLVLVLRAPVRRAFCSGVAYALWLLPVARLLLPPLPAEWQASAVAPISQAAQRVTVLFIDAADAAPAVDAAVMPDLTPYIVALWAIGAVGFIGWHLIRYHRFVGTMLRDARATTFGPVRIIESDTATGPLAFGIWRKYVAFPSDFKERYDAEEQALALAHELTHHARGDLIANWVALGVLALHWFNPLAWRAFRAFRADQEMACDERVLAGRAAKVRHAYGRAIVKSAHGGAVSAACHLHTINELKGRLRMLSKDRVSKARIAGGAIAVAAVALTSLGLTASGTQAAERLRSEVKASIGVDLAGLDAPKAPLAPSAPLGALPPAAPVAPQAADLPPPPKLAEAPPAPAAPEAPAARTSRRTKIIIRSKDGKVETIDAEGDDAEDALARALPGSKIKIWAPEVIDRDCPGADRKPVVENKRRDGKPVIIICRNRIDRMARNAQRDAQRHIERADLVMLRSVDIERDARRSALDGVRAARAGIVANRDMAESARAAALKGIDQAIAELEADAAKAK